MKLPDIFATPSAGVLNVTAPTAGGVVPTDADTILSLAMDIGEEILRCGGEINRVENTVVRVCRAYGAESAEVFAITSLIVAEIRMPDGTAVTHTRRVPYSYTHLARLEACNALSRMVCKNPLPADEVAARLAAIHRYKPVPEWARYPAAILAVGGFSIFFGGTWRDGLVAAVIGLFMTLISRISPLKVGGLMKSLISSLTAGLLAVFAVKFGLGQHVDKIIIGTIMLEIPGLSFGNALRDMLGGDTLAGTMRFIQAVLLTLVIAIGYMAALAIGGWLGGVA